MNNIQSVLELLLLPSFYSKVYYLRKFRQISGAIIYTLSSSSLAAHTMMLILVGRFSVHVQTCGLLALCLPITTQLLRSTTQWNLSLYGKCRALVNKVRVQGLANDLCNGSTNQLAETLYDIILVSSQSVIMPLNEKISQQ